MPSLDQFNSNLGTAIALVGGAGAGKTTLAGRLFPRTHFLLADLNFQSGISYWKRIGCTNVVGYDNLLVDDTGKPIAANQRYKRMMDKLTTLIADPKIDAIAVDSGTFINEIIKAKICGATSDELIKLSGYDHWGSLLITWKSLLTQLRQSGKKVIFTFHEEKEKDESDQIFKYKVMLDGKIAAQLPALVSDVWRCEVAETNGKHTWNIRPLPNVRQEHLKNTFGFTGVISQDEAVKLVQATLPK